MADQTPLTPAARFLAVGAFAFGQDAAEQVIGRLQAGCVRVRPGRPHVTLGKGDKITRIILPPGADDRTCVHEFSHALHRVLWPRESETFTQYRLEMAAIWGEARFYTLWDEHNPGALQWWLRYVFSIYYLHGKGPYRAAGKRLRAAWDAGEWDPGFYNPVVTFGNVFHERRPTAHGPYPPRPILSAD